MIAKIHSGQRFAGLVDYANDIKNKKADIIASEGVDLTSNKTITSVVEEFCRTYFFELCTRRRSETH